MSNSDTSASLASQASTISEQISITASHLDQNVQNDGEYVAKVPKQYHADDFDIVDNDISDEDVHGNLLNRGPYFEMTAAKNVTAIAGQSAYLNCRVRNLGNRTVRDIYSLNFSGDIIDDESESEKNALSVPSFSLEHRQQQSRVDLNILLSSVEKVKQINLLQVSWIRHRDLMLLTVMKETYTPDQRFQSVHNPHTSDYSLKVIF